MTTRIRLNPTQIMAVGFAALILAGGFLLTLPISNREGEITPFFNALFTATSATCVTGLVVYDTYTHFSTFGQIVILTLIQIGGLGFMSVASLFALVTGKRIGLYERSLLVEAMNTPQIGGIVRMIRHLLIGTFAIEATGAALFMVRFVPELGFVDGLYYGIFHSISSFCNAGFDLMGRYEPFSSLVAFRADPIVNLTVMALIVIGGLGFGVWEDVFRKRRHVRQYSLHTKVVLLSTIILVVVGAILFYVAERNHTLRGVGFGESVLASLFHSVTPRTAGFNTVDLTKLSPGGNFLTSVLMIIGGSPGSTAGGIKTTTIVVLILALISQIKRKEEIDIFGRRLDTPVVQRSFSIATLYMISAALGIYFVLHADPHLMLHDVSLEVFSALSTVGLSTGITRELSPFSRVVLVLLMYAGRVGGLSVLMALTKRTTAAHLKHPVDKISIG